MPWDEGPQRDFKSSVQMGKKVIFFSNQNVLKDKCFIVFSRSFFLTVVKFIHCIFSYYIQKPAQVNFLSKTFPMCSDCRVT